MPTYRIEPMNGFSGTMCDYKAHESRRNMYTADMVRIYREFVDVAGKHFLGNPNNSLAGVKQIKSRIPRSLCNRVDELPEAFGNLLGNVDDNLNRYITDDDIELDSQMLGSAIVT